MKFVRGLVNLKQCQACVATIGNFDGVHLGHRAVIQQLKALSDQSGLPTSIIVFEPQPIEFFSKQHAPSRLMRLTDKLAEFKKYAIDQIICLRFNEAVARQDATQFTHDILYERIGVRYLVIGDDFCFGKDRRGDFDLLTQIGKKRGFKVISTRSFCIDGERVSSTNIRYALHNGDIDRANMLLGRAYRINGRVVYGEGRGATLGYPTANIKLNDYQSPLQGIFTAYVYGIGKGRLPAVAYIGKRPVFAGKKMVLEVHILDFDQVIYGKRLAIELISKLRDEGRFRSVPTLLKQMKEDIQKAREELI